MHCVEHQHRKRIALEDTNLESDGGCLPGFGGDHSNEVFIEIKDHVHHLGRSVVVIKREVYQHVVNTAKSIA